MKVSAQTKRMALMKTFDYLLEDPEKNIVKVMDMLDKHAPADLFPSQRQAFRANPKTGMADTDMEKLTARGCR